MGVILYYKYNNYVKDVKAHDFYDFNSNQERVHTKTSIGEDVFLVTGTKTRSGFDIYLLGHLILESKSINKCGDPGYKYGAYRIVADKKLSKYFDVDEMTPLSPVIKNLESIRRLDTLQKYCQSFQSMRVISDSDTRSIKQFASTLKSKNI